LSFFFADFAIAALYACDQALEHFRHFADNPLSDSEPQGSP
jgi:hypothetical protein